MNTLYLKLPLSRTYFHGSKGVRAIEVLLYVGNVEYNAKQCSGTNTTTSQTLSKRERSKYI